MKKMKNLKPGLSTTSSLKKIKNNPPVLDAGSMLNQKTNEDHNKQKPDPKDPNETKNDPNVADSSFVEADHETSMEETTPLV